MIDEKDTELPDGWIKEFDKNYNAYFYVCMRIVYSPISILTQDIHHHLGRYQSVPTSLYLGAPL